MSREDGEALLERLADNTLTAADRQTLGQVVTFHFRLLFALREAKLSLRQQRVLVFGEPGSPRSFYCQPLGQFGVSSGAEADFFCTWVRGNSTRT